MSPFMKKKKSPFELEEPDSLDAPSSPSPGRFGAKANPRGAAAPAAGARPPALAVAIKTEAPEEGAEEAGEDFGAKLARDIDAVAEPHGMSVEQGRAYAADLFAAVADCLAKAGGGGYGGGEETAESETPEY
jgi:hypothetical protein